MHRICWFGLGALLLAGSVLVGCSNRNNYGCPGGACGAAGSGTFAPAPMYAPGALGESPYGGSSPGSAAPVYPAPGSGSR